MTSHQILLSKLQKEEIQKLKEQIVNKEFIYEEISCVVCKTSENEIISENDRYGLPYRSNLCKSCGLIYTSPRFDQNSYIKFYDENYRKIYTNRNMIRTKQQFFLSQVHKGRTILNAFLKNNDINNVKNVLEVGCGMGGILLPFKEQGKKVYGVDYGSEYADYGKKMGLNISIGGITSIKKEIKFDLIIYSHVFEHILDLNKELEEIKERLNPNGRLYIEVPGILNLHGNYRSNLNRYLQNAHTYNFSLTTLCNILKINGFKLVYGNEKVEAFFMKSTTLIDIQNDYDNIFTTLKKYESKKYIWAFTLGGIKQITIIILQTVNLYKLFVKVRNKMSEIKAQKRKT